MSTHTLKSVFKHQHTMLIVVAALGYFVDIYDLILFNIVKKPSLLSIGVLPENLENIGIHLFNMQMTGMLFGGILWGVLGDKKGRLKVLFGSIILYSVANILNAFVTTVETYSIIRFVAGVGLAGELGAGITLISETMDKENRGYGTMVIVTFGALGAVLAAVIADVFDWKTAYIMGGALGLALLVLRVKTMESKMFNSLQKTTSMRATFAFLFLHPKRFIKYLSCIFIGLPIWFIVGVLIALCETFAKQMGVEGTIKISTAVAMSYIGLSIGDLLSGTLSQWFKSRKKVVILFLIMASAVIATYLFASHISVTTFYFLCFSLGFSTGFWAIFVTIASEQFGTNIRSTVTNTVPNFVRGAVVPITLSFKHLAANYNITIAAIIVGSVCLLLSLLAVLNVEETFGKDLNYSEDL